LGCSILYTYSSAVSLRLHSSSLLLIKPHGSKDCTLQQVARIIRTNSYLFSDVGIDYLQAKQIKNCSSTSVTIHSSYPAFSSSKSVSYYRCCHFRTFLTKVQQYSAWKSCNSIQHHSLTRQDAGFVTFLHFDFG
jgi:hypothetical protein